MRILRVTQKAYPDVKGGAAYHTHAMSRDQAEMGHDVTLLTVRQDDSLPHVEERDGYTVVRFDSLCSPLGNDISPGLAQYLQEANEFDVIHAHSHLYFATNLAALKRQLGDTLLAITNHGLFSQNAPKWVFDLYLRSVGRWTFNQADLLFCYTDEDKKRVQEYGVSSRIEVVSNGIDTERFSPRGPESELVGKGDPVVLFVGRLVEGKQPSVAVEAMAGVLEAYPEGILYFCGEGPLRDELQELAEGLGIRDHVRLLGQVPYEEMPAVYRAADVLVLPSRAEGTPRTVMEALSSDVPVVNSDLSQVRSAFGEHVAYFDCGDVASLAEKIRLTFETVQEPHLKSRFNWKSTVEETTTVLEEIVREER
ncbi:glycosyltransferase family 4 protein [Halobacteriaceae archaeon SHR40]|uniref:glycosyltransferase family 4 protein n=1 Tax=Halovenus amylolytica TaxID=2500550 RepID=UPI000FE42A19